MAGGGGKRVCPLSHGWQWLEEEEHRCAPSAMAGDGRRRTETLSHEAVEVQEDFESSARLALGLTNCAVAE